MKKKLLLLLSLSIIQGSYYLTSAQTALVQVIHNAPDPSADTVDIYVNGLLVAGDFSFRQATPYLAVPAGFPLNVGVAPGSSVSVNDTLKNFEITFTNGQVYTAIANGVLNPGNFAANPNSLSTLFDLTVTPNMLLTSQVAGSTGFVFQHGTTDAPLLNLVVRNDTMLADHVAYRDVTGYSHLTAASYFFDVKDANVDTILSTYAVDLSMYGDSTAVFFTSGFMDSSLNQGGPVMSLFAAFSDGSVVEFPQVAIAFLQAIHNSADPAADSLDIYALGTLAVDNFYFRTATNYLAVPAGIPLDVGVALGNSTSISDTIRNFPVIFENGKNYIALAAGVIDTTLFAPNPDGNNIAFDLKMIDYAVLEAATGSDVDYIGVHGVTDAPTLDVAVSTTGPVIIDNASYGGFTPYINGIAASYNIDVTDANNTVVYSSWLADLVPFAGQSAVIFSSGFMNPALNQNGASFGLFIALSDGSVFPFINITSINENRTTGKLMISPNPAGAFTTVYYKGASSNPVIELVNAYGQSFTVEHAELKNQSVSLNTVNLQSGIYFIRITDGSASYTGKLVVE